MSEEVTVNDIAAYWKLVARVRYSACQGLLRRTKQSNLTCLSRVGNPVTVQVVGADGKPTAYPEVCWPQDEPEIDWKKFCSDPFGMAKKEVTE
jgi:hypothetical protein